MKSIFRGIMSVRTLIFLGVLFMGLSVSVFLSQHQQNIRQQASSPTCNSTGVTKNTNGTYTFAWLHVDNSGNVVDINGCVIHLLGLNTGNTYWGNAEHPDVQAMAFYKT